MIQSTCYSLEVKTLINRLSSMDAQRSRTSTTKVGVFVGTGLLCQKKEPIQPGSRSILNASEYWLRWTLASGSKEGVPFQKAILRRLDSGGFWFAGFWFGDVLLIVGKINFYQTTYNRRFLEAFKNLKTTRKHRELVSGAGPQRKASQPVLQAWLVTSKKALPEWVFSKGVEQQK